MADMRDAMYGSSLYDPSLVFGEQYDTFEHQLPDMDKRERLLKYEDGKGWSWIN